MGARSMSQPKRIALSLGAGASKPLGFPLTGEILPEILARLGAKSLFGPATAKPRPSEADLRAFLFELMPGLSHHDSSPPLITDVLSLIDQMLAAGNVPGGKISDSQMRLGCCSSGRFFESWTGLMTTRTMPRSPPC